MKVRVYMALEQWEKALADAEMVLEAEMGTAAHIILRTTELEQAEALLDSIKEKMQATP